MQNSVSTRIQKMIYVIRGQKVMLDCDLAELYGVETRILNRDVKRNIGRFPEDFIFQLNMLEFESLISQIGISKAGRGGRRKLPYVFTENGIAMLSSVLNSTNAIQVNITIMRIFNKLRGSAVFDGGKNDFFKIVFEKLDEVEIRLEKVEENIKPILPRKRKKIGL